MNSGDMASTWRVVLNSWSQFSHEFVCVCASCLAGGRTDGDGWYQHSLFPGESSGW